MHSCSLWHYQDYLETYEELKSENSLLWISKMYKIRWLMDCLLLYIQDESKLMSDDEKILLGTRPTPWAGFLMCLQTKVRVSRKTCHFNQTHQSYSWPTSLGSYSKMLHAWWRRRMSFSVLVWSNQWSNAWPSTLSIIYDIINNISSPFILHWTKFSWI